MMIMMILMGMMTAMIIISMGNARKSRGSGLPKSGLPLGELIGQIRQRTTALEITS
jgi:hypothetical protein